MQRALEGSALAGQAPITLDALALGAADHSELRALSRRSGGKAFLPTTLRAALRLCELEPVIALASRPPPPPRAERERMEHLFDDEKEVPMRPDEALGTPVLRLDSALARLAQLEAAAPRGAANSRAVLAELRAVAREPHPAIDVYPSENVRFWRFVVEGPEGTPYRGGAWAGTVSFSADFPGSPPSVRLSTPILALQHQRARPRLPLGARPQLDARHAARHRAAVRLQ